MTAYRNEIIKDNYVEDANPQLSSFAGFEYGGKRLNWVFWRRTPQFRLL